MIFSAPRSQSRFICLTFIVLFSLTNKIEAQNTVYSENISTGGNAALNLHVFQNSACSFTYSGTGGTANSNQSNGYPTASGAKNVTLAGQETFIIGGINTLGYSGLTLSYGIYKNTSLFIFDAGLTVEVSTNGSTYTVLTRPGVAWSASWIYETCSGNIPSTANLYLRFTNNSAAVVGTQFKIDDILLQGASALSVSNPTPYNLWPSAYTFSSWPSTNSAGTYPANMIFHYASATFTDPTISQLTATQDYSLAYNSTCGSRIRGQGTGGISFVNDAPGNITSIRGNLGEAVLSLNTSCRRNIQVSWIAGTITNASKPYKLRGQYRLGSSGAYTDLPNTLVTDIEYTSPANTSTFGPITLPASCDNQPVVQIRWVYFSNSIYTTGSRDEIFLDNVGVTSSEFPLLSVVPSQTVCGGKTMSAINFTSSVSSVFSWTNNNSGIGLASAGSGNIPSFTTSVLTTTVNQVASFSVIGVAGTCSSAPVAFSITVRAPQSSSIWNGTVSNSWDNPDNWSNCVCGANTNATIALAPNNPTTSGISYVKDLTVNNSASLTVGNSTLNVYGNIINNGGFLSSSNSVVKLGGTTTQTLGGISRMDLKGMVLDNTSGARLTNSLNISGTLLLTNGTFSTGNLLTLASGQTSTGRIGPINSGADITGSVTVQRLAPGGSSGWAQLGSPMSSALTMSDWNDDFFITCLNCPDGYYNFSSIYAYDETAIGSYTAGNKYVPVTNISDVIVPTRGYWVYLANGNTNSTDITFDVTGTVNKGSVSMAVTNSSVSNQSDYGWNLLSNPLPSPISWTSLLNGNINMDNAFYVYNADASGGAGGYASYINGISTGGLTDNIAMCQGFYVHAKANTILNANENTKVDANPTFFKTSSPVVKPVFRLLLSGNSNFSDETVFYFDPNGTKNFQGQLDAYKLNFDPSNIPYLASLSDTVLTSISGLPELKFNSNASLMAITPYISTFTFSAMKENFPQDVCVTLFDKLTGIATDLIHSDYICTLYDTTSNARFTINFFSTTLAGSSFVNYPGCENPYNGNITAFGNNSGPWNYEWKKGNTVIRSITSSFADTLTQVSGGIYHLKINTVGQCDRFEKNIVVNGVEPTTANFSTDVQVAYLSGQGQVGFNNTSSNAKFSLWDFGDGNTSSSIHPSHSYKSGGIFNIMLVTESNTGCFDTINKIFVVQDDLTGLNEPKKNQEVVLLFDQILGKYSVKTNFTKSKKLVIELKDVGGKIILSQKVGEIQAGVVPINMENFSAGTYILNVIADDHTNSVFKLSRS